MKTTPMTTAIAMLSLLVGCAITARSDTFGSGANTFTIEFVNVGNAGNAGDAGAGGGIYSSPYGGVAYDYRVAVTEVPQEWITKATASGLTNVAAGPWAGKQPATNLRWYHAAAFVNWLNTSTGHHAAYSLTFSGGNWSMTLWSSAEAWQVGGENLYRHKDAFYFLPSINEWYKAAYHKNDGVTANYWDYATGSNSIPTPVGSGTAAGTAVYGQGATGPAAVDDDGGPSAYGTRGQNGNVYEWLETAFGGINDSPTRWRMCMGSSWGIDGASLNSSNVSPREPTYLTSNVGFRVASVPAPDSTTLSPTLTTPANGTVSTNTVTVTFYLPESAQSGSVKVTFSGMVTRVMTLATINESVGNHAFSFDASGPFPSADIASGTPIQDGTYTVTLSYQDALGNPTAFSLPALNVTVNIDADGDGILDKYETGTGVYVSPTNTGTSPTNPDTDGDGLTDGQEVNTYHSNPNVRDTDGDGFDDGFEVTTGFNPTSAASTPDSLSSIRTAAEYRFNAALGISYRIEASTDLATWTTIEPNIIGAGGVVSRFYSIEGQARRYFRSRRN